MHNTRINWLQANPAVQEASRFSISSENTRKDIFYVLAMIPYPSWAGMHLWHVMNYSAVDAIGRFKRFQWFKVLNPICWDSFWLPTENYAMSLGKRAWTVTQQNIENFKKQALTINWWYDWTREFATSDPEYYKWTQWIFSELFKAGLVYKEQAYVNWCPKCNTALANDQVIDWKCERDETEIIQKLQPQWFVRITDYADRLITDLEDLDWPEETKRAQINWIWRREWIAVKMKTDTWEPIPVFIEQISDIKDIDWIRICPEHQILNSLVSEWDKEKLEKYREAAVKKTNLQRQQLSKENDSLFLGLYITNPMDGRRIPLIVDERILPSSWLWTELVTSVSNESDHELLSRHWLKSISEETLSGTSWPEINIEDILSKWYWEKTVIYKLRNWSISRQRYWGAPIPVYYDHDNNPHLIDESELPVVLPLDVDNYKPLGKSPLEEHPTFSSYEKDWVMYRRECDTLDTFVDSSFYYLRFLDPNNQSSLISPEIARIISDVDFYMWGREHTVGHLLYARFIHKFLYDRGIVQTKEPFKRLFHQGMILAADWRKMSKRWGNIVDPISIINEYDHDVLKMGVLFLWPLEYTKSWDESALRWVDKFLKRVRSFADNSITTDKESKEEENIINRSIRQVSEDISSLNFNTAITKLMVLFNSLSKLDSVSRSTFSKFLIMLSVFAPDTALTIWEKIWNQSDLLTQKWPEVDESKIESTKIALWIQVNWKHKKAVEVSVWLDQEEVLNELKANWIYEWIVWEKEVKRIIFKKDRMINFVV